MKEIIDSFSKMNVEGNLTGWEKNIFNKHNTIKCNGIQVHDL